MERPRGKLDETASVGATADGDAIRVVVWAPNRDKIELLLPGKNERRIELEAGDHGYHATQLEPSCWGRPYWFLLDGHLRRADPASRFQPQGVHGPSQLIDPQFAWDDQTWQGLKLEQYLIYELHVGTYSPTGDFAGVMHDLDRLVDLGITAIELMPVAQFPGRRNWGYDGVFPFAPHDSYGGPAALKRLVNACHRRGLAVILDVVYNHLGPEGNYLADFGPYFTGQYHTPWGDALNFDGADSDGVRKFFIDNALHWIRDFHIDGLRLDAIQMIFDNSARPFLTELAETVHAEGERLGRRVHLWGETNQNDVRHVRPRSQGGVGLDGVWNDDFHHALHARLTGERMSVYLDHGDLRNLGRAYQDGFVLSGQYSAHRRRHHGSDSRDVPAQHFVVFAQNHDQIGNRLYGDRLSQLVPFEALKLAAASVLLAPNLPLLFMGEEFGEVAPFLYFVDHQDGALRRAVKRGRVRDFKAYRQAGRQVPDPTRESTFACCRLSDEAAHTAQQRILNEFYRELIALRKQTPALAELNKKLHVVQWDEDANLLLSHRQHEAGDVLSLLHFGENAAEVSVRIPFARWQIRLDSADTQWGGPGSTADEFPDGEADQWRVRLAPYQARVFTSRDGTAAYD